MLNRVQTFLILMVTIILLKLICLQFHITVSKTTSCDKTLITFNHPSVLSHNFLYGLDRYIIKVIFIYFKPTLKTSKALLMNLLK